VLGGGRWARVLTSEICKIIPAESRVMICSPGGWRDMLDWAGSQDLGREISVSADRHAERTQGCTAAVVACASRDHASAVRAAVEYADAILVEKPFACNGAEFSQMEAVARGRGVLLCPAHVFLFTRYLNNFGRHVARQGAVQRALLQWWDASAEQRYGESKAYDSSISVFADVLPHVVSVLESVFGERPEQAELLRLDDGGARVELRLRFRHFSCDAQLGRDRAERRRALVVHVADGECRLDWTVEPGLIHADGGALCADERWGTEGGPLSALLTAFLRAARGGEIDNRLSLDGPKAVAELTDAVQRQYQPRLLAWAAAELTARASNPDLRPTPPLLYALSEIVQRSGRLRPAQLAARMQQLLATCVGHDLTAAQVLANLEADRS
jgi:predicted dehydrogenase